MSVAVRVGFGYFSFGQREIHRGREREGKKERGRDDIDNKKELKNNKEIFFNEAIKNIKLLLKSVL